MRWLGVIFLAGMLLVGCSTDEQTLQLIEQAESVMIDHPDSALRVIRSVDTETIRGEEDMAHYRLAMAEAMYYNRLTPNRDSIAQPLFDYYLKSDDHAMRARAMYQHALVMQSDGENAKAMYSLLEAEKSLEHVDNPRLAGLVHRTKGDIYGLESLYYNALVEYQIAKECFDRLDLPFHSAYSLYDIGKTYHNLRDFSSSIQTLCDAESLFAEIGYSSYVYDVQIELCYIYIELGDFDNLRDLYRRIDVANNVGFSYCDYFSVGAVLLSYDRDFVGAENMLDRAKREVIINYPQLLYAEFQVRTFQEQYKEAIILYKAMIAEQDNAVYNLMNNSLLQSQVRLIENERVLIAERAKLNKICLISVIVVLLLVIVAILLYMRYHNVKKSKDIANYISIIAELEQSLKSVTKNESSVNQNADIIELNKICEIYYQYANTSHLSSKIIAEVSRSIESIKTDEKRLQNLENIVNLRNHNVLSEIIESCPKINNKEYRYIIYNLLGFSSRSMAMLLDIDTDALARLKYKVKVKLRGCENAKIKNLIV